MFLLDNYFSLRAKCGIKILLQFGLGHFFRKIFSDNHGHNILRLFDD